MRCFEVWVNGQRLYAAGLPAPGRLHGHLVSWERLPDDPPAPGVPCDLAKLHFSGSDGTGDYVSWPRHDLGVGDEVVIRVVDLASSDQPTSRLPLDEAEAERGERAIYERLRQRFDPSAPSPAGS